MSDSKFDSQEYAKWKKKLKDHETRHPPLKARYSTWSDLLRSPLMCTPEEIKGFDYERDLGYPGEFPYTRGVHSNMYRGKMWTMRQFFLGSEHLGTRTTDSKSC